MSTNRQGIAWNRTGYFPKLNGPEMGAFKKKLFADAAKLRNKAAKLGALSTKNFTAWEELVLSAEDCEARIRHFSSYLGCLEAGDSGNNEYGKKARLLSGFAAFEEFESELLRALTGLIKRRAAEKKRLSPTQTCALPPLLYWI